MKFKNKKLDLSSKGIYYFLTLFFRENRYFREIISKLMQSLNRISRLAFRTNVQRAVFRFSSDSWRDRDEAAEKVFISRKESKLLITQGKPFNEF